MIHMCFRLCGFIKSEKIFEYIFASNSLLRYHFFFYAATSLILAYVHLRYLVSPSDIQQSGW